MSKRITSFGIEGTLDVEMSFTNKKQMKVVKKKGWPDHLSIVMLNTTLNTKMYHFFNTHEEKQAWLDEKITFVQRGVAPN